MVAYSDEKNCIAYLHFYDFDMDWFNENASENTMIDFVKYYFKYPW